jgi:RIO kinase 1
VLHWAGGFRIIDFPQAVDARFNPNARSLLLRDVERLFQYFARYDVAKADDALEWALDLWGSYERGQLQPG